MKFFNKLKSAIKKVIEKVKGIKKVFTKKEEKTLERKKEEEQQLEELYEEYYKEPYEEEEYYEEDDRDNRDYQEEECEGDEVYDVLLVRDTSYEERKKRRVHEISIYAYVRRVRVDTNLDKIAERVFHIIAEHFEGGAFAPLLYAAFSPLSYSVDAEGAEYCSDEPTIVDEVTITITTHGRRRRYSDVLGIEVDVE